MRYTESKMTAVAELLIEGIGEDAVDFRTTYDEENSEPVVLPGAFPNLLANGATGIAVGMATSIPPHNAAELCDAALALIRKPDATVEDLLQYVEGPDFPTGGVVIDSRESILESYRPAAAASGFAPSGRLRRPVAAATRSSSPRCPTRCRSRG
jgi:topoisomerase-4 subunit A